MLTHKKKKIELEVEKYKLKGFLVVLNMFLFGGCLMFKSILIVKTCCIF